MALISLMSLILDNLCDFRFNKHAFQPKSQLGSLRNRISFLTQNLTRAQLTLQVLQKRFLITHPLVFSLSNLVFTKSHFKLILNILMELTIPLLLILSLPLMGPLELSFLKDLPRLIYINLRNLNSHSTIHPLRI